MPTLCRLTRDGARVWLSCAVLVVGCAGEPGPGVASEALGPYGLTARAPIGPYLGGRLPPSPGTFPPVLSAVGVFSDLASLTPAPGLVPYGVNAPLWSDASIKTRWIAVPTDGPPYGAAEQVAYSPSAPWTFPDGTVFVKHFELVVDEVTGARRRLETRILVRQAGGGVYGITYKWRPDGMEADLIDGGLDETYSVRTASGGTRSHTHTYPSRGDCTTCHNSGAGLVLGVHTAQLNGLFAYPSGVSDNQLHAWNNVELLSPAPAETAIASLPRMPALGDTSATLEDRARAYVHSNCAHCHMPGGSGPTFDARFSTPLSAQSIIDTSSGFNLGRGGARIVAPRDVHRSMLHARIDTTRAGDRMPPLARNHVDDEAAALLRAWIDSMLVVASAHTPREPGAVRVVFSQPVDPATALATASYTLSGGVTVSRASLGADGASVTLGTSPLTPGSSYTLAVRNVRDLASPPSTIVPGNPTTFVATSSVGGASAHWPLDERAGTVAGDASGNGYGGSVIGAAAWLPSAQVEGGIRLDGLDDEISIGRDLSPVLGSSASLVGWIRTTQVGNESPALAPAITGASGAAGVIWGYLDGSGRIGLWTSGGPAVRSAQPINDGRWHHVALTRDSSTGEMMAYVDGVRSPTTLSATGSAGVAFTVLGRHASGPRLAASLDELRIFDRVLTSIEIGTLLDSERPTVTVEVTDASAAEPADPGAFTLTRTGPTSTDLEVGHVLAGSAAPGVDYVALGGTTLIPAGAASVRISVTAIDDTLVEPIETVSLRLVAAGSYFATAPFLGEVTIADDDPALLANGAACSLASACASGLCVDGVCCNSACAGGSADCQACSVAAGGPADGTCAPRAAGITCRSSRGVCDAAETCSGASATCPPDAFVTAGTTCRAAGGPCDPAEVCTGSSEGCPADGFAPASTPCGGPPSGVCDAQDHCSGTSATCVAEHAASSTVCRAPAGPCDVAERCTGLAPDCPGDAYAPSGLTCRAAAGPCDVLEACSGAAPSCPADGFARGTACRASRGACDPEEVCSGLAAACAPDAVRPAGTPCGGTASSCSSPGVCDGVGVACGGGTPRPAGTVCLAALPGNPCDVDDVCDGVGDACAARYAPATSPCGPASAGPCDAPDHCAGASAECVPTFLRGVECRAAGDACDAAETCTGTSATCPSDALTPAGVICRAATGACDREEACDGASAACPGDEVAVAGTLCRAVAGACDEEDRCDGTGTACADALAPVGVTCRPALGECDVTETCGGASVDCPPDLVSAAGTTCRAATSPSCDIAEVCDGAAGVCPPDETACGAFDAGGDDAGAPADAEPHDGGEAPPDARARDDAEPGARDARVDAPPDAGLGPPPAAGCACRASHSAAADEMLALAPMLVLALAAARRRARPRPASTRR